MSPRRSWAVAKHDLRILRTDPAFLVVMTGMPLIIMAFLKPAYGSSVMSFGATRAAAGADLADRVSGAGQAVPGVTVMFAFFLVGNLGFGVFREHGWNTWERLRASPASPADVMAGKVVVPLLTLALQLSVLLGLGGILFGLRVGGSILALVAIAAALAVCLSCMGFLLLAFARSVMQLNAASNLGAMLFAGLGGAIAPISTLPDWARAMAPATPSYWAMRGFRSVIAGGAWSNVALPIMVLALFAVGFAAVALVRFRFDEAKVSFA